MIHGMINVYKEAGFTSHDAVAKLRGIARQRKIGHTGTLDPDAVGVLPVCLGSATRLCDLLTDKRKSYRAEMLLGQTTDTEDVSGTVLTERPVNCTEEQVRAVMESFLGPQMQVPPMYSALQVDGKRLYELAREGKVVEREPRPVHFYEINFLKMEGNVVEYEVTCSKGTYIRTLCADMGEKLGCGACMKSLVRYQVDCFRLEDALTLAQLQQLADEGRLEEAVMPVDQMFARYPSATVTEAGEKYLMNGNPLTEEMLMVEMPDAETDAAEQKMESEEAVAAGIRVPDGTIPNGIIRVYDRAGRFQALYVPAEKKTYRPWKTFFQA